ncbi:MAG: tetratricopeptide repeat protein [Planctomycetota bacterium]|jgi:hypothetical protein
MERLKSITIIFLLAVGLLSSVAPAKTASVLLQEGLYAEEIEGDLDGAIQIYKQVVSESKKTQRAAAQATYRIGMCYLKKGEKAKAAIQFSNLVSKFPGQKAFISRAQGHLAKLKPSAGSFGPVMERVINDDGEEKNWLIDFDTGRLFTHSVEIPSEEQFLRWCAENRIDAMGETRTSGPGLYGFDMTVIPIAAETWETISPKGLADDLAVAKGGTPAVMSAAGKLPVTYIFKTREGGMGIVQILEMRQNKKPRHFKIRYKMLQELEKTSPVEVFGPEIEQVIFSEENGTKFFFDLDTTKAFSPPPGLTRSSPPMEIIKWGRTQGIDLINDKGRFELAEMVAVEIPGKMWYSAGPTEIRNALKKGSSLKSLPTQSKDRTVSAPVTYAFKTREGGIGILQIMDKKNNNLRIRYKMLRPVAMKETVKLNVGKPAYEWWTSEPTVTKTIFENSHLEIDWEITSEVAEKIEVFCIGVMPTKIDIHDFESFQWLGIDIPATARSTPYGKNWKGIAAKIRGPEREAKPLFPGEYRIVLFAFANLRSDKIWTNLLKNNLHYVGTAKLIVKPIPKTGMGFLSGVDKLDLEDLIKELHRADAPRFVALNKIIEIGEPAVERLIAEIEKSNDWQIPKALGAIKDKRAVEPLIQKWQKCDWSPMKEVISEALERITGKKLGQDKQKWDKWWKETKRFISPEATLRNFMAAAMKLDKNNAMEYVAVDSHDYKDTQEIFEESEHPFNVLFRKTDPSVPVKILETKIIDNMCEAVWQITFKEDFTIEGKTFKAGETFDIDGNLRRYGDKWLITGI